MGAVRAQLVSEIEREVAAGRLTDWWTQTDGLVEDYDNHRPLPEGWEGVRARLGDDDDGDTSDEGDGDWGSDDWGDDDGYGGDAPWPALGVAASPVPGDGAGAAACPASAVAACPASSVAIRLEPDASTCAPPPLPPPESPLAEQRLVILPSLGGDHPLLPADSVADEADEQLFEGALFGEGSLSCYRGCIELARDAGDRALLALLQERLRQVEKKNHMFVQQRGEVLYLRALRIERDREVRAHIAREREEDAKLRHAQHKEKMELHEAMGKRDQERVKAHQAGVAAAEAKAALDARKKKATPLLCLLPAGVHLTYPFSSTDPPTYLLFHPRWLYCSLPIWFHGFLPLLCPRRFCGCGSRACFILIMFGLARCVYAFVRTVGCLVDCFAA